MKVYDVIQTLGATVSCGEVSPSDEVKTACGADLMSDVLAYVKDDTLILTGMVNPHVIRTAEMLDVHFVMFVRGKEPTEEVKELAQELGVVLMRTEETLFTACGMLYSKGLLGCKKGTI